MREQVVHGWRQGQRARRVVDSPRPTTGRYPLPCRAEPTPHRSVGAGDQARLRGAAATDRGDQADVQEHRPRVKEGLITRPKQKLPDLDSVVKVDQFRNYLTNREFSSAKMLKLVGSDTLDAFGRQLVALHSPVRVDWASRFGFASGGTDGVRGGHADPTTMAGQVRRPVLELRYRAGQGHRGHLASKRATDALHRVWGGLAASLVSRRRTRLTRPRRRAAAMHNGW